MPPRVFAAVEQSLVALMDYRRRSGFDKANLAIAWAKARRPRPCVKFILVVVLVAAAFLGGAFVNGPGLQWAQTRVLRSLGLNNAGEITSVDLKPAASSESSVERIRIATKPDG